MKRICILALAFSVCLTSLFSGAVALAEEVPVNLVPETPSDSPNTFSTWWIQSAEQYAQMGATGKTLTIRDVVTHDSLFNQKTGWCYTQYPTVKKDMIFVVCDGWELPDSQGDTVSGDPYFGSQVLDAEKFPGYGDTPQERLKTYADNVKAAGWKGAGLWICAQEDAAHRPATGFDREYWIERILWSKYAGITYWEIDWGTLYNNLEWRRFISDTVNELYPELVVEHITGIGGLNDEQNSGRVTPAFNKLSAQVASFSDVFRTYDVTTQLTNATTLDRVGELLRDAYVLKGDALGLMCAEDQVYINASLGLTSMVFRHNRNFSNTDEVVRAMRWNRIAPAYEISAYETTLSEEWLSDDWEFRDGDTWYSNVTGKTIVQKAPAVIARGIGLASVSVSGGDRPFVTAARNPNGAISVATFGRTHGRTHTNELRADVTLPAGDLTGPVGVFGYYNTLTLSFQQDLTGKRVLAQDLLAEKAEDITGRVQIDGCNLTLTGALIDEIGLSAATEGDTSRPGLVLQIGDPADYVAAPQIRERVDSPVENLPVFYNASFEESAVGVVPAAWNLWRGNGTGDDTILTAAGGHTGEKACRIAGADAHEGSIGQSFTGIANGTYTASVWVKGTANSGGINFSAPVTRDFVLTATWIRRVSEDWAHDETTHWNPCNEKDCTERFNEAPHTLEWIIDRDATDSADGIKHQECAVCGYRCSENTVIPKTHMHSFHWQGDAGQHWRECDCGEKQEMAPHNFVWKTDKKPTSQETGIKHEECTVCGVKRSEGTSIPKTENPQTGDACLWTWLAVLIVSGSMLMLAPALLCKKRHRAE